MKHTVPCKGLTYGPILHIESFASIDVVFVTIISSLKEYDFFV